MKGERRDVVHRAGAKWITPFAWLLGLLVLGGCASTRQATLPPITPNPTGQHQTGKFVWFDLLTENVAAAQNFYGRLFGWRFSAPEGSRDYTVIYAGDKPVGGMVPYENTDPKVLESIWLSALSVDDVDRAVAVVKARHGKVLDGPLDVKGRGRMAVISDPEGAVLVLIRAAGGDPADAVARAGEFLWVDLVTRDAAKAGEFYGALTGYTAWSVETKSGHSYDLLHRNGRAYGGIVQVRAKDIEPNWLPYIRVDDLEATMRRAARLGGVVILRIEHVAVIADPTGGVFGVQVLEKEPS